MKDLGITKGECHIVDYAGYKLLQSGEFYGDKDLLNESEYVEAEANAVLFKDSFDTAQECGLLPSELLKQRDELLSALKPITKRLYKELNCPEYNSFIDKANKAIKKTTE